MIKVYGSPRSSAMRCIWTLEEVGAEYEVADVNISKGETKTPEYLVMNPNGKVPTLVDGDFILWESLAIDSYIAEKFNSDLVGKDLAEKSLVNQWSLWSVIHLYTGAFAPLVLQKWRQTPDNDITKNALAVEVPRFLKVLNDYLAGKNFMVSERFTLADISAMSAIGGADFIGYDLSPYQNILAWKNQMAERPAYKKIMGK